jgi:succinate dehydrogenase/fumarate reductase flavoprotein subunit
LKDPKLFPKYKEKITTYRQKRRNLRKINTHPDFDYSFDIVVVGSGAAGMPAALNARKCKASVIVVEANFDVGGHAILSGGNVALGGGTPQQIKYGINDTPDLLFNDLIDWSVVQTNGMPSYRYNDRDVVKAFADNNVATYNFLVANGVKFVDEAPNTSGGHDVGQSVPREHHALYTGGATDDNYSPSGAKATEFIRSLEASARKSGVKFLLNYHMDSLLTDSKNRVIGISAHHTPTFLDSPLAPLESYASSGNIVTKKRKLTVRANRAVILATGGHSSNVNFRRMFDPRLTEEYSVAGEPYSFQDASGELAAMKIGAALWGTMAHTIETGAHITKPGRIGTRYGYINLKWPSNAKIFSKVGAIGLIVRDYQDLIFVNMLGNRFYDETQGQYPSGNHKTLPGYTPASWKNARNVTWAPQNYLNAAMQYLGKNGDTLNGGGPIWAIFDSSAVKREGWVLGFPNTDPEYFYEASNLRELATKINANKYQKIAMKGSSLEQTVSRYNSFVSEGVDRDFEKSKPLFEIADPPFYAAFATPIIHDTRCGLRINKKCQVIDVSGNVIAGLYCAGESAGGFNAHGLARCAVQGYIAGMSAAKSDK